MPPLFAAAPSLSLIRRSLVCLALGLAGISLGCQPSADQPSADQPSPAESEQATEPESPTSEPAPAVDAAAAKPTVEIEFASLDEIGAMVKKLGRPAVVDYWSLACPPCMEEFPGLVKLHLEHGDQLSCIAVDVDYDGRKSKPAESYREAVTAFLETQEAAVPSYICTTPSDEVFAALKIGSIPTVILYAADGSIVKKFVDAGETAGFGYEKDIVPAVEQLLKDTAVAK
ncbi:thiol-disulfide oxidoreductase [Roseimaritima multifibrata]|uniref:Thiol-disulfide oxidoreductase n=1 Tax=Roseimaritima multifibrata TaxID=1930274 RepID=A0A517MBY8_9BACT|nr:TlpA disulfide reductase family protein [Roseimaritima multifibrata]QDS92287.1 thiol-disulfide oxidoreductase [Roseimaritima multifibrata]